MQKPAFDLGSQDPVLCGQILVPQKKFLVYGSGDVSQHACPKHFAFPQNPQPRESEIVDAVFQSEKSIRGEPVESCKLRYFNSFEFLDHTSLLDPYLGWLVNGEGLSWPATGQDRQH